MQFINHCEFVSMELCEVHCLFYQIILMSPHGDESVAEVVNSTDCDIAQMLLATIVSRINLLTIHDLAL